MFILDTTPVVCFMTGRRLHDVDVMLFTISWAAGVSDAAYLLPDIPNKSPKQAAGILQQDKLSSVK